MNWKLSLPEKRGDGEERRSLLWVLAALVVVLVLAAAACGGDDDGEGAPQDTASADTGGGGDQGGVVTFEPGQEFSSVLLPKQTGVSVFDQANQGAEEAAGELQADTAEYLGPASPAECVSGQLDVVTNATTQGRDAIMISNCAGDQIEPSVQQAADAGVTVVSWDSPIPSGEGESVFIAQVDFDETGVVMADMALEILGQEGGEFAILSASADAANQNAWIAAMEEALQDPKYENLELVDTVYGDDDSEKSYDEALGLVDKHPNLKLIMAPTTVGIAAAGKAMTDEGLCDQVKVSGLGLPEEMVEYTLSGCAPQFALWSFVDLGYLAYYTAYGIATGQIEAEEGVQFEAGRLGEYTIEKDPTRDNGLRVLMGPFTVYDETNVEQ
ncbi:MAG TPA: rhamnose ABC transporter substrate-binding protein [Actinomycetota bacterium]|nr:rhamnose ABC transporter substrate-binding protein [Actinomycetota bacterium]